MIPQFDSPPEDQVSQLSLTNMYFTQLNQQPGGQTGYIAPSPGTDLYVDFSGNSVRSLFQDSGNLYAVVDSTLYRIDSSGAQTTVGTLNTSSGYVSFIANTTQIMLADGTDAYVITKSSHAFATVSDADFPTTAPIRLAYLNGYGCFTTAATKALHLMDLSDFTSYTSTQYTTLTDSGETTSGCIANNGELFVFTKDRCAVYVNTAASPFPFEARSNILLNIGCSAELSLQVVDNTIIWLGTNEHGMLGIYRTTGYLPKLISSDSLNAEIRTYSNPENAISYIFSLRGHYFYHITFPDSQKSWRIDLTTGLCHEVTSRNAEGQFTRHLSSCYTYFDDKHLVGDYRSGKVYEMSQSFYTDNDTPIEREIISIPLDSQLERMTISELTVDMQVGKGLSTGQGSSPQAMLSYSTDGGNTWSAELWRSVGKIGEYRTLVRWNRLGQGRRRVFKLRYTEPTQFSVFNLLVKY